MSNFRASEKRLFFISIPTHFFLQSFKFHHHKVLIFYLFLWWLYRCQGVSQLQQLQQTTLPSTNTGFLSSLSGSNAKLCVGYETKKKKKKKTLGHKSCMSWFWNNILAEWATIKKTQGMMVGTLIWIHKYITALLDICMIFVSLTHYGSSSLENTLRQQNLELTKGYVQSGSIYVGWMKKCVNRKKLKVRMELAIMLQFWEIKKESKYRKQRAFVGLGRSLVSIVVAIRGPL